MRAITVILTAGLLLWPLAIPAQQQVPGSQAEISLSFAPVVRQSTPAVVNIYATRIVERRRSPFADDPFFSQFFGGAQSVPRAQNSLGSGVIVSPDGIVVSNHHVVGNAREIRVVLSDRREYAAEILLSDAAADIAVIRLQDAHDLPYLELGDSEALEVGDLVLAIGNPFGVGQTVTSGIISALARSGGAMRPGRGAGSSSGYFVQTDAPINPGNSGGALVDMTGRLVGVNTSILTRSGGSNGIGFAIPSNLVRQYIRQASEGRDRFARPWSGIAVQQVDHALSEALGQDVPAGVLITQLHPDSPFAAAGLRQGDVILALDGQAVNAAAEFEYRLAARGLNAEAEVAFRRAERAQAVARVRLGPAPDTPRSQPVRIEARSPLNGLVVADVNPRRIEELGLPLDAGGVAVLRAEGYAARLGLQRGDVVEALNGVEVDSAAALDREARRVAPAWILELLRDGRRIRLQVRG